MNEINYEEIVDQLKSELDSECAIADKHGVVLASRIKEFSIGKIVPHSILELIAKHYEISKELNLKKVTSFAVASEDQFYLFTFSEKLILISKLDKEVNLIKFMPNISVFLQHIESKFVIQELKDFTRFDFSEEIEKMKDTFKTDDAKEKKYSIIKALIKYISN
ncbi:MAG: hypothetical protein JW891_01825 [Candidatus Lokiarchaeota archaeon]|nr:hypothetical protein [Candidatus Lokiarchaeota archaeon]